MKKKKEIWIGLLILIILIGMIVGIKVYQTDDVSRLTPVYIATGGR